MTNRITNCAEAEQLVGNMIDALFESIDASLDEQFANIVFDFLEEQTPDKLIELCRGYIVEGE
jgi:hypothetical protein